MKTLEQLRKLVSEELRIHLEESEDAVVVNMCRAVYGPGENEAVDEFIAEVMTK